MQPQIQPTLAAKGNTTQPLPKVQLTEADAAVAPNMAPSIAPNPAKPLPFWRGVIAASIVMLIISAILAGILLILPATH